MQTSADTIARPKGRAYAAYLRESMKRQRDYIGREQARMAEAGRLFGLYAAAMARLDLHPLDRSEIGEREQQLNHMLATVEETHGDNQSQRAWFATMEDEQSAAAMADMKKRAGIA